MGGGATNSCYGMEPSCFLVVRTWNHASLQGKVQSTKKKRKQYTVAEIYGLSSRRFIILLMSPLLSSLLSVGFINNDSISMVAAFQENLGSWNYPFRSLTMASNSFGKEGVSVGRRWKVLEVMCKDLKDQSSRRSSIGNDSQSNSNSLTEHPKSNTFMGIRSIGVDYGTVRTGVAISRGLSPRPLVIVKDLQNTTEVALQIARICEAEGAQQLVLGLPLDKDGSETKQAGITRRFASTLAAMCLEWMGPNFALWFWDERYTSKFAMARLQNSKVTTASYRAADFSRAWIDADSACIILEDFYSQNGDGAERIMVTCPETRLECLTRWEQRQEQKQAAINLHNQQRDVSVTARRDAMRRAKEREEQLFKEGITYKSSKVKAKKPRKKSSGWITL